MAKKDRKKPSATRKLTGDDRVVDLLERLGTILLYTSTNLSQNDVAHAVGIDVNRVNKLVKSINKVSK